MRSEVKSGSWIFLQSLPASRASGLDVTRLTQSTRITTRMMSSGDLTPSFGLNYEASESVQLDMRKIPDHEIPDMGQAWPG